MAGRATAGSHATPTERTSSRSPRPRSRACESAAKRLKEARIEADDAHGAIGGASTVTRSGVASAVTAFMPLAHCLVHPVSPAGL